MSENAYQPISCAFHDRLEDWAIRRAPVEVVWRVGKREHTATAIIADVFAKDGADWIRLETGDSIRLDHLVQVDGITLPGTC